MRRARPCRMAVEIRRRRRRGVKEQRLADFAAGRIRVLITSRALRVRPQLAARSAHGFVGVTDSFEAYYQAVRRCWRFGQTRDVHVHVFASSAEGAVVANLRRKERDAGDGREPSTETRDAVMASVTGTRRQTNADHTAVRRARARLSEGRMNCIEQVTTDTYTAIHGDCVEALRGCLTSASGTDLSPRSQACTPTPTAPRHGQRA